MSSLSSITNRFTAAGLATGLDTDKIVEGLLAVQQRPIDLLRQKQARLQAEQAAYTGIEARLLALQGQIAQLARAPEWCLPRPHGHFPCG